MNRRLTNLIRFFMDDCLPPIIRDSKIFMYPFFWYAYRGKNISKVMDFKKNVYSFSLKEYEHFYNNLDTISRHRLTDLNQKSLELILKNVSQNVQNMIDVGCGNGYLLKKIKQNFPHVSLFGFDVKDSELNEAYAYQKGRIENLPYADKSFDMVTCSHVLEHILDFRLALKELKRITRKKLIIVIPRQRYFYYTLDEHVNFYPHAEKLVHDMVGAHENYTVENIHGDWMLTFSFESHT